MMAATMVLATQIWPALALAAVIGTAVGLASVAAAPASRTARTASWLTVLALAGAAVLAARGGLAGRPGLWLDMTVLMTGAYVAACAIGWALRMLVRALRGQTKRLA